MKKIPTSFRIGVLMSALCVGLVACNDGLQGHVPEAIGVFPVPEQDVPEKVSGFFEENPTIFDEFFSKIDYSYDTPPPGFAINSMEEFREHALSSVALPEIDFDKYTLVIGRYYLSGGVYLKGHAIDAEPAVMNLNFVFGDTGKGLAAMFPQIYCELYPKLPRKPIEISWTIVKEY